MVVLYISVGEINFQPGETEKTDCITAPSGQTLKTQSISELIPKFNVGVSPVQPSQH